MQSSKTPSERPPSVRPDDESADATAADATNGSQLLPFPSGSDLNARLRRLIVVFQREHKREELRLAAIDKRNEQRDKMEQVLFPQMISFLPFWGEGGGSIFIMRRKQKVNSKLGRFAAIQTCSIVFPAVIVVSQNCCMISIII
jgi:hypothetical protein